MADKFHNKYRVRSARAAWWNYGMDAAYFITICTKNREHFFGEIMPVETPSMPSLEITAIGKLAVQEWLKTPSIRPDMNLKLDDFVIMPNHFHAIIHIGKNDYNHAANGRDAMHGVSTAIVPIEPNEFGPQMKNLSSLIRGYKSAVTMQARKNNISFEWQARFHDHIIRTDKSYQRIKNYIIHNPSTWKEDKFYTLEDHLK